MQHTLMFFVSILFLFCKKNENKYYFTKISFQNFLFLVRCCKRINNLKLFSSCPQILKIRILDTNNSSIKIIDL